METVLIHWSVDPEQVADFQAYRTPIGDEAAGFVRESLYRVDAVDGVPDGSVNFVNIGVWTSRAEFYEHFKIEPGSVPPRQPFEVADRRREWLAPMT